MGFPVLTIPCTLPPPRLLSAYSLQKHSGLLPLPPFTPERTGGSKENNPTLQPLVEPSIALSHTTHPFQAQVWIIAGREGGASDC